MIKFDNIRCKFLLTQTVKMTGADGKFGAESTLGHCYLLVGMYKLTIS
jgi:hypothetical protein